VVGIILKVAPPTACSISYSTEGAPPILVGALQCNVAYPLDRLLMSSLTFYGDSGYVMKVKSSTADLALSMYLFEATTKNL